MNPYDVLTIWVGKSIFWTLRRVGRHGAALPGLIVEKLNPRLIGKAFRSMPHGVLVVSGTNGKTTTTHLIASAFHNAGLRVFTNHSGSNMTRGLLASIVRFASLSGKLPYDIAVLEIDEAYAAKLAPIIRPNYAVLTNVLRDQLDRFGEIDHTAELLKVLAEHTSTRVIANSQDPRIYSRLNKKSIQNKVVWYGHSTDLASHFPSDDDWHGQMNTRSVTGVDGYVLERAKEGIVLIVGPDGTKVELRTKLEGWHNAINLCAAYAAVDSVLNKAPGSYFNDLSAPYGRGEIVRVGDVEVVLQLVKNPAGFRIAMDTRPDCPAMIVINDSYADSRDVSWLWDVDVEPLRSRPAIVTSGTRAKDMAVRLKYSEINVASSTTDIKKAVADFIRQYRGGVVFLTYTGMLQVRSILHKLSSQNEHKKDTK